MSEAIEFSLPGMREINLLPAERQSRLVQEVVLSTLSDLANTTILSLTLLALLGALIMGGSRAVAYSLPNADGVKLAAALEEYKVLQNVIDAKNERLHDMASLGTSAGRWASYVDTIFSVMPPDTTVRSIDAALFIAEGAVVSRSLAISGQAANRNTVSILEDRLRSLPTVKSVEAPSSNFVKREQPSYLFTLTFNETE